MNAASQPPSRTATTLVTWAATLSIVWSAAAIFALVTGHVTMVAVLGIIVGLPVAIRATRSSNQRKAILRAEAARRTPAPYRAQATR